MLASLRQLVHRYHALPAETFTDHEVRSLLAGSSSALQGAKINDVLRAFADKEWESDWAEARREHGHHACATDLARSHAQKHYKLRRDPDTGRWRTYRPDGTEIE